VGATSACLHSSLSWFCFSGMGAVSPVTTAILFTPPGTAPKCRAPAGKVCSGPVGNGGGQLTINGGGKDLLDADFTYSDQYEEPRVEYSVSNGVGELKVSQDSHSMHFGRPKMTGRHSSFE